LFNGETRYGDDEREKYVRIMLEDLRAKLGAVDLVNMRGMTHRFAYSQLEKVVGQHAASQDDWWDMSKF
jgi:hypothetical protein